MIESRLLQQFIDYKWVLFLIRLTSFSTFRYLSYSPKDLKEGKTGVLIKTIFKGRKPLKCPDAGKFYILMAK